MHVSVSLRVWPHQEELSKSQLQTRAGCSSTSRAAAFKLTGPHWRRGRMGEQIPKSNSEFEQWNSSSCQGLWRVLHCSSPCSTRPARWSHHWHKCDQVPYAPAEKQWWLLLAHLRLWSVIISRMWTVVDLIANTSFWEGEELTDKIGTVKLRQSVTLPVRQEHLLWEKLPNKTPMTPGSMPIVEPMSSKSMHINIIVGSVITSLWDGFPWRSPICLTEQVLSFNLLMTVHFAFLTGEPHQPPAHY